MLSNGAEFRTPNSNLRYWKGSGVVEALRTYKFNATTTTTSRTVRPLHGVVSMVQGAAITWYCMFPDDEDVELSS